MIHLSNETVALIEDIERRIDADAEEDLRRQWKDFLYGNFDGDIFRAKRKKLSKSELKISPVNINDAINDYDLMLRSQLLGVSSALGSESSNLCIRANYGTGIVASMFGAELFMMPRETNTLPGIRSVNDSEWIRKAVEGGVPDKYSGLGRSVIEFTDICAEVLSKYPKISKYVSMYHPDLQGPLDNCELLWGGEMFYAMYDEPELVHAVLSVLTDTYKMMMDEWFDVFEPNDDINVHWERLWHRGKIMLRSDSAMNISPEMYEEFSVPYDTDLLKTYGGGAMHFCGKGDHYIELLTSIPGLTAINISQPEYNDMEKIYKNTVDKGIMILSFNKFRAAKDKDREGGFHHRLSI